MPCSLGNPCGGQARLMVVLPDAHLYQCINGHTLREGAPPPTKGVIYQAETPAERGKRRREKARAELARIGSGRTTYCGRGRCRARPTKYSRYCHQHREK